MDSGSQARAECFRRGVIAAWYLKDYQLPLYKLILQTERDIIAPNITRRYGKSTVCVTYAVEQAIRRRQNIRYATAFLTDLENFIEPIFDSVCHIAPEDAKPQWLAAKKTWIFPNGSKIKLVGLDKNPNGIRGNAIDILIIDEAAFVSNLEYLYKSIIVPATMNRKFKIIFPSTPPVSPEHFWAKDLVPRAMLRGTYLELTIDDITDLSLEEKTRLIDEVGGPNSTTAQREFYCKIVVDRSRAIAPEFSADKHVVENVNGDHIKWDYIGDSGGIRDKTSILKVGYCHDIKKIIIDDEIFFDQKTPTPVIASKFKTWSGRSSLVLDAPGQTLVDIASLGLQASLPVKDEFISGIEMLNALFYNDDVLINKRCSFLITTLKTGLLNKQHSDYERSDTLGHCDAAAALVYALRMVDKVSDLRPREHREQIYNYAAKPKNSNLKRAFA